MEPSDEAQSFSAANRTATLRVTRVPAGRRDRLRAYSILLDSQAAAKIRPGETVALPVAQGRHSVELAIDWARSRPLVVDLAPGETIDLRCAPNTEQPTWIGITVGRGDYVRLWRVGGPEDDRRHEERYPFPALRLVLLGLALAALGIAIAHGRIWAAVLIGLVALVPAVVIAAWIYARTRSRDGERRAGG